jgi:ferric-dicitrate binding protein FerR (iron transport regulator)
MRLAAAVTFLLALVGVIYLILDKEEPLPIQQEQVWIQKSTENGQKLSIRLPDGSQVKLNSNSNISISENFSQNRNVKLTGEAFFNVASDSLHPFVVSTAHFQTKVLGTSFNVQAYGTQNAKVSVEEGLVQVAALKQDGPVKFLEMHEAVEINGDKLYSAKFNRDEILWKDGVLVFSDEDIQSISDKIQRWFNVKVRVKNGAAVPKGFSGKYSNESLEEILSGMSYALDFTFEINGNEILIIGKEKL